MKTEKETASNMPSLYFRNLEVKISDNDFYIVVLHRK